MKSNNMKKIFLFVVIFSTALTLFSPSVVGFNNAPNGVNSETPDKPKYFNFMDKQVGTFRLSHYSTHDWITDAALRLLIDESGNGAADWRWLLSDLLDTKPKWISSYGNGLTHHTVRSYISFLFATQMPDMNSRNAAKARPHKHPQIINLMGNEGEKVGNGFHKTLVWVGRSDYQTFHWTTISHENGQYTLIPKIADGSSPQLAPLYAWRTSKAAITCLTHQEQDQNNNYENWAKPEAAACWLGVMSHYIADLACPPHLIQEMEQYYPTSPKFHGWFEDQISKFTNWDVNLAGPKGYHSRTNFFNVDMRIVGEDSNSIMPTPPHLAAIATASYSIMKSYGHLDEGGLFIKKGDITQENIMSTWNWGDPGKERNSNNLIISGGLTYKQYYDKVEYLLNTAVYYTAAAMKWTINEAKKNNNEQLNPDQWAKLPFFKKYPDQKIPIYDKDKLDDSDESEEARKAYKNAQIFIMTAMLTPIYALVVIPAIIYAVFEKPIPVFNF